MVTRGNKRARRALAVVAGFGLVAGAVIPAAASNSSESESKISPQVQEQLRADGNADVWLDFGAKADLSAANSMSWVDRGQFVYDALNSTANASQEAVKAQLDAAGVDYTSFYIVNAIKVSAADAALVKSLAAQDSVAAVYPEFEVELEEPVTREASSTAPQATEWGVDNINAPAVWDQFDTTGEGITVASVDTGAQYDHPALVGSYRGNTDGTFDHNYNWFDAQYGSDVPVDEDGHGTHVTGTMAGDDGEGNQIGVAPGADWISASGCCPSDEALITSMEWMLAPTDLNGENADPDMRPHVVNNSWGSQLPDTEDPFGDDQSEAWTAAGIFGTWANGNSGEFGCESSGTPGSRTINYSVGAYDVDNAIAYFSGRGPGQDGTIKPNISAPGVNVRSSVPEDDYANYSGTSMAAPHLAGAVALLWAAVPEMEGDVEGTRALLNETAIDTEDLSCGGDAGNNNVYGEGRLDVLALVEAAGDDEPVVPVDRYEGEDRYGTAADVANYYGDDVETVYVTTGEHFADSLAGSPAAARGIMGTMETPEGDPAPVLLVKQDSVPNVTADALDGINPANIVILGNEGAVSEGVAEELDDDDTDVRRIGGEDRYDTAALLAEEFTDPSVIYVAVGAGIAYADALSGSALAGSEGGPILLVKTDSVPTRAQEVLNNNPDAQIVVLGGEAAVSQPVYDEVGADERLAGSDRYRTALMVSAEYESADVVYVATGLNYPDALAGGALAGSEDNPVLMVKGTQANLDGALGQEIQAELARLNPDRVVILGGTAVVSEGIANDIRDGYDD